MDYSYETAKTIYGFLGINIWICKEEVRAYTDKTKYKLVLYPLKVPTR